MRAALFPVVGEKTLRELVREAKAHEHAVQDRVQTVLRASYSNHYRWMLPPPARGVVVRLPRYRLPAGVRRHPGGAYAVIRQPTDPTEFITGLRERMATGLVRLDAALVAGTAGGVAVTARWEPWISVPKPAALPEPVNLAAVMDEVVRRWGTLDLLDVRGNADFLTEFTMAFTSVASRKGINHDPLRRARFNLAAALALEAST